MYHKLSIEETLEALDVNPETGLSDKEASLRTNQSEKQDGSSFYKFAALGIARPVIILLIITATISAIFGDWISTSLIFAVIIIHTVFSAQCKKSGTNELDRTISPSVTHAIVLRNGAKMKLTSDSLVVGDVVTLKPGRVVPADIRLITSENLVIDESSLTGRARVEKDCTIKNSSDVSIERRDNCAFEGTVVISGRGDGVVTATGMSTEMSRLTLPLDIPEKDKAPLFSRTRGISRIITVIFALGCGAVFFISLLHRDNLMTATLTALSLAVAVIPESISTGALTALSRGAELLRGAGFLAKNMQAVERLGEVTVFTTDIPQMGVAATYTNGRIHSPQDEDTIPFIEGLLLCELKNAPLRTFAENKCNAEKVAADFPKIGEFMGEVTTTLHRAGNTTISYTGGDAEEILARSSLIWDFGKIRSLVDSDRNDISDTIRTFAEEGYSITAIGLRSGDDVPCDSNLIFLGIAATNADSEIPTTPDTAALNFSGAAVYLLTESDAEKAKLGASLLSLSSENIICGREVANMQDDELAERLRDTFVFTSLRAQDKVRIINLLKSRGKVVATIGDKMSDVPALDASDIGLADIRAQDAAKGAADVVFDGSTSADYAIHCGKIIRSNIRKVLTYLAAANSAELICILFASLFGFGFALTPLQILLINLITDTLPVMFIARGEKLYKKSMLRLTYILGAVVGVVSVAAFAILSGVLELALAQWVTFAILLVCELALALPIHFVGRKREE